MTKGEKLINILTLHCGKSQDEDGKFNFTKVRITQEQQLKLIDALKIFFNEKGVLMELFNIRKNKINVDKAVASILFNYGPIVIDETK